MEEAELEKLDRVMLNLKPVNVTCQFQIWICSYFYTYCYTSQSEMHQGRTVKIIYKQMQEATANTTIKIGEVQNKC